MHRQVICSIPFPIPPGDRHALTKFLPLPSSALHRRKRPTLPALLLQHLPQDPRRWRLCHQPGHRQPYPEWWKGGRQRGAIRRYLFITPTCAARMAKSPVAAGSVISAYTVAARYDCTCPTGPICCIPLRAPSTPPCPCHPTIPTCCWIRKHRRSRLLCARVTKPSTTVRRSR